MLSASCVSSENGTSCASSENGEKLFKIGTHVFRLTVSCRDRRRRRSLFCRSFVLSLASDDASYGALLPPLMLLRLPCHFVYG
jgi:hypothetical protein